VDNRSDIRDFLAGWSATSAAPRSDVTTATTDNA
jgi:hypothetical protein